MLEMLMKAIYDAEDEHEFDNIDNMLPCHYFDYFYGTSTGGLGINLHCKRPGFY